MGWKGGWNGLKFVIGVGGLNVPFAHILVLTLN